MSAENPGFIQECEAIVEIYMSEQCRRFVQRCEELQEGVKHPNWRTAEAMVKNANQAMDQVAPDVAKDFYFYIHFTGNDYVVNTIPPEREVEE